MKTAENFRKKTCIKRYLTIATDSPNKLRKKGSIESFR